MTKIEGTAPAQLQRKLDEIERKHSLKELREKARQAGVSPSGTKRDIARRLFVRHARHALPVSIMAQSVPKTAQKDRRTAFYVQFWSPKSTPETSQPYYWDGPEERGAFKTLNDVLRAASDLERKRPDAFAIVIYSREERYIPDEEYPDLYGYWEPIDGTMKTYDRRGAVVDDKTQGGGRAPQTEDKLFGRHHWPLPDEAY